MATTIPLTVSKEAAEFLAEKGLQAPFEKMLDGIPQWFEGIHEIKVNLHQPYDLGGGPSVVFEVTRDHPGGEDDPSHRNWGKWVIGTFPPEEFQFFKLLTIYANHAR